MYLITFIKHFFISHFTINFVEIDKPFPCKTACYVKRQKMSKVCLEKFSFYGLNMEPEP